MKGLLALLAVVVLVGTGCGHRYEVVRRAPRSPIGPNHEIVLREPKAGDLVVNGQPESAFVAKLDASNQRGWVALLDVVRRAMVEGLMQARGGLQVVQGGAAPAVELELVGIDLAQQNPRGTPKTKLRTVLRIFGADGQVADEVQFTAVIEAEVVTQEMVEATRERRLHRAGTDIGRQAADYLRDRAGLL